MPLSARNQLRGHISDIQLGEVIAHVSVGIGENVIEAVITRRSVEQLGLKKGDMVTAIIKSTDVMLLKE
jgi:molybdopterin-binding protein